MPAPSNMPRYVLTTATILFCLWAAGFIGFYLTLHLLKTDENSIYTDAVIVLTGGPERINTGLDLLNAETTDELFITGVDSRVTVAELISLWNDDISRPPCCITLGHEATNTRQNALETMQWVKAHDIGSVRLVTADYHIPRAYLEFTNMMPSLDIHIHPVASKPGQSNAGQYWLRVFGEYHKTLYTWLRLTLTPPLSGHE